MGIQIVLLQFQIIMAVVLVLAIRLAMNRLPKIYSYILWILVFARLLCPVALETDFGIMPSQKIVAEWVEDIFYPNNNTESNNMDKMISKQADFNLLKEDADNMYQNDYDKTSDLSVNPDSADNFYSNMAQLKNSDNDIFPPVIRIDKPNPKWINILTALIVIWISGIVIIMGYNTYALFKVRKTLKNSVLLNKNIYICNAINTPFTLGVIRPRIYIPEGMEDEEQRYVICHENVHIIRKDYIIKNIAFILTALYWLNPFVWIAFYFLERDMEMSCDEKVIKIMGADIKKQYSQSLLNFAQGRKGAAITPLTFGENNVKLRIKNVLSYKNAKRWSIILGMVILVAAGIVLFTTRTGVNEKNADMSKATAQNDLNGENRESGEVKADNSMENNEDEAEGLTEIDHDTEERAVDTWARAFVDRNGQKLYELAADKEEFVAWDMVNELEDGVITFGLSSPWPWDYTYDISRGDDNSTVIRYYMNTSVPEIYIADEEIQTVEQDGLYYIEHKELKEYYSINTREQFEELYGKDSYDFGYANTGYTSSFYMFIMQHLMNGTNPEYYEQYTDPVTAAVKLLHLGEGEGSAITDLIPARVEDMDIPWIKALSQAGEDSRALVTYTFEEDGSSIEVVMELIEGSQGIWAPLEDGDRMMRQVYNTYRLEPYESGGDDDVYIQTSQYGIYRLDKSGLRCIYPGYIPESTVFTVRDGKMYFPESTTYREGDLDYAQDTICVLDIKTGEYDTETFKLGQNANNLFPLIYLSIHSGYMDLYGENEAYYSIPLINTGVTALDRNTWNNKAVSELDEREQNEYGKALREQILKNPDTLIDVSNRAHTETFSYIDMDGDGKAEKISIYSTPGHSITYDYIDYKLKIGDAQRNCFGENLNNYIYAYSPDGSRVILALYEDGPSGDPMTTLYTYDNGEIKYVGSFADDIRDCLMKNGVIYGEERHDVIQTDRINADWRIDQNGQLNRTTHDTYDFLTQNDITLKVPLPVHSIPDENSESHMLKPQVVKFLRTDSTFSWVYAEGADGDSGWFEVEGSEVKELGKISIDVFDELLFYD
ncbi:MAG: hypothetical protein J1D87_07315 [Lachnospiraceae bacterium]|nr:hypothetical protein [Lachnospiraceae bacterium]